MLTLLGVSRLDARLVQTHHLVGGDIVKCTLGQDLTMDHSGSFNTERVVVEATAELADSGFVDAHEIGRGGFGVVYRCSQVGLDRVVAVKVLVASLEEENRERFDREQRAMGQLTGHPNIVGVLQVGATPSGLPYLVMPYYAQGALHARLRRQGPLTVEETLRVGVKIAGALESAHRLGILHRDVKPGNILITDYGEATLADFGIARLADSFRTASGAVAGSPAYTAPEVLAGEAPSPAADVYGLGATLFAVLTGHAAFERRSGEQVVAQFLRITQQPIPDLRKCGVGQDLAAVIERAMARDPGQRPTAAALGEDLRRVQEMRGWPVDGMALRIESDDRPPEVAPIESPPLTLDRKSISQLSPSSSPLGGRNRFPLEMTSFVGRRAESAEVETCLRSSRLVTVTGIGGVGKTRLVWRVANSVQQDFADGVRLVELGDLRDGALLPAVIGGAVGLRPAGQPMLEALIDYMAPRTLLLVLDNCEHLVDDVAKVVGQILPACQEVRILASSREALGMAGETVVRLPPLPTPDPNRTLALLSAPGYDAVNLFVERARAAVPDFVLGEDNVGAVGEICRRLDGLPLLIELAAARLRALSPEQILQRLTDRFGLLTSRSRGIPSRHQTVRWCVDWSYSLCSPAEQDIWARMSVFAGNFELEAAEYVCRGDRSEGELLDVLTALVDKSILIREESDSTVRFRELETVREYGRMKLEEAGECTGLRGRHRDWYRQLAEKAEANWIGPTQLHWVGRLNREQANLREALDFCLALDEKPSDAGLAIAVSLRLFWFARGQVDEARYWLERALIEDRSGVDELMQAKALQAAGVAAELQGDPVTAAPLVLEARALAERTQDVLVRAYADLAEGTHAIFGTEPECATLPLEAAVAGFREEEDAYGEIMALQSLGWASELQENSAAALHYHERALATIELHHDNCYRAAALWATAVAAWHHGERGRPLELLRQALQSTRQQEDPLTAASVLEALAWIVGADGEAGKAARLMGAAMAMSSRTGSSTVLLPKLVGHHEDCVLACRRALGRTKFETAFLEGSSMDLEAVASMLEEHPPTTERSRHS